MLLVTDNVEHNGRQIEHAEGATEVLPEPPRPVRVGWVASKTTFDRFGRTVQPLAVGMLDEFVALATICPRGTEADPFPSPPVRVVSYEQGKWWQVWSRPEEALSEKVRGEKLQLLHALDADAARLTARLARTLGIRYVLSCYSLRDARRLGPLDDRAAAVLPASTPIGKELRRHRVVPPDRIVLLRPGVHRVRHANCFKDPQHSISIVTCGPLDDLRAYAAVLRSFAELASRNYDCAFFVIGGGPAEGQLRALSEKLATRHEVTFAEDLPARQLPGIFKAADIYVSPTSRPELDVRSLLAMAAGVPVLAAAGGSADFLKDKETALRFRRGDTSELITKLLSLLEDRAAARDLAENALRYLRENHSPSAMVASLAAVYRQATAPADKSPTDRD